MMLTGGIVAGGFCHFFDLVRLMVLVRGLDLFRFMGYKRILCAPRLAEKDVRQRGSQHQ